MITLAAIDDAVTLSKIHGMCFVESWDVDYFKHVLSDPRFVCFKIERGNEIAGFSLCLRIPPEMELLSICITPEYQHLGLGKLLISNIISYTNQDHIDTIFLEVSENNKNAIKLYEHAGFLVMGRRSGYYIERGKTSDAILYRYDTKIL